MKYLFVIPATFAFCILMHFFSVSLPKLVRTTDIGKRIWPSIERFWGLSFSTVGFCLLAGSIIHALALRWDNPELVQLTVKVFFLPAQFVFVSFLLLLALVITLKILQFLRIIR